MNIVKQSGIPYEILLRFAHPDSANKDVKLGEFIGAHYIEAEALVDADSGEVIQYKPGATQDMPRDKVADYLGDRFVAFEAQQRTLQAQLDQSIADGKAARDKADADASAAAEAAQKQAASDAAAAAQLVADRDATIAARDAQIATLQADLAAARGRLGAVAAALA